MFDFFDNQQNPFMFMMNMMGNESIPEQETAADAAPMQLMQQMFMMQMQFMQTMLMMPLQLMQGMAGMMNWNDAAQDAAKPEAGADRQGGFKLGNMTVPPELIRKLMQMDMTPENLEKLQRVLDFIFEAMPAPAEEQSGQGVDK